MIHDRAGGPPQRLRRSSPLEGSAWIGDEMGDEMGEGRVSLGGLARRTHKVRARELRGEPTRAEARFWVLVRQSKLDGLRFRRQHQIGPWIVDFYCHEQRLVIELIGGVHDGSDAREHDAARQKDIEARGFRVLELLNAEVLSTPQLMPEKIQRFLAPPNHPHPTPKPSL